MKKYFKLFILVFLTLIVIVCIILFKLNAEDKEAVIVTSTNSFYASSAVVMEASTGRLLYERNPDKRLLTASIAKILTCIVAIENIDINKHVIIDNIVLEATGSSLYLQIGDVYLIRDLLYGIMLQSGNDASLVVAQSYSGKMADFIIKMNDLVKKLKMSNSSFENPTGLDEKTKNYSSARDMAFLMAYAMKNETFREIVKTKVYRFQNLDGKYFVFNNKHRLVRDDDEVIGGKTGYTKKAGRTLVSYFKRDLMEIVVVSFDASNDWKLHRLLADEAFEQYEMNLLLTPFTFQMSILSINDRKKIKKSVYFPLRKNEEVDIVIVFIKEECFLKVIKDGHVISKLALEVVR